jgi:hypothetical protein
MTRFYYSIFIIALFSQNLGNCSLSQDNEFDLEKGWFRICDKNNNGRVEEIQSDQCPNGAWLSQSVFGECVCLNGL